MYYLNCRLYSMAVFSILSLLPMTSYSAEDNPTNNNNPSSQANKVIAQADRLDPRERGVGRGDWSSGVYYNRNNRNNRNTYFYTQPYNQGQPYYYNNPNYNNPNYNYNNNYYDQYGNPMYAPYP